MSCCAADAAAAARPVNAAVSREELLLASRDLGDGVRQVDLAVPEMHCADCIRKIERGLAAVPGVTYARVNLSTRRASVKWSGEAPPLIETLEGLGYAAHLFDMGAEEGDPQLAFLLRALAVAGFSSMNIMLLSVSVWSGADPGTRQAFHWISALLALPALVYSGQVFFRSAWSALRHGRSNMDVPISIGVLLAFGISVYDTYQNGPHAYFDAATSLLFFLLIGRVLDHMMREKARKAVSGLVRLAPRGATVLREDGSRDYLPVGEIEPGMALMVAAGDRVPVDGTVASGASELDCSVVTGESMPQPVGAGSELKAGMLNLTGGLTMVATARSENSFLAEMVRLMEVAEGGKARYRQLADRAAQLYSPVIHATALLTFIGWLAMTGDWHRSIGIAIAVLIITCPCALGLAVPIVQVVAARRLFENGIMVKDGSAMERMAEIDTVAFDKTGTLTLGRLRLEAGGAIDPAAAAIAASLAATSNHPVSRAIAARYGAGAAGLHFTRLAEIPGQGIEAEADGAVYRLGRADWALGAAGRPGEGTVLSRDGQALAAFAFRDDLRPEAREAVADLRQQGIATLILSGDQPPAVAAVARDLGIGDYAASVLPAEKLARVTALAAAGHKTLMVGDGLNDAPVLAAAHVSMAPATAADIGRNAADFVFLRAGLGAVPLALAVSREAGRLIQQNFGLAILYNLIALPIAIAGFVTPLIASLAMSLSSIVVVANALRLKAGREDRRKASRSPALPAAQADTRAIPAGSR
ncbi:heavy metal translocating P-type ATPase [Kaistia granuli]|uniref:heavy metal translocating P-type ATPase n=1 Tax=Kaistia granuli TaxID=363259 RepID=UPI00036C1393|nr:heavy metal translocating P-type ATPase [Kaistia granuli]